MVLRSLSQVVGSLGREKERGGGGERWGLTGMKGDEVMGNGMCTVGHSLAQVSSQGKPDRPDSRAPRVHPTPLSISLHVTYSLLNTQGISLCL